MKDATPELISGVAFVVVGKAVIEWDESGARTDVGFAKFYYDFIVASERDRSELGGRSYDRPPQTLRAFGRQELPASPSLPLQ